MGRRCAEGDLLAMKHTRALTWDGAALGWEEAMAHQAAAQQVWVALSVHRSACVVCGSNPRPLNVFAGDVSRAMAFD